MYLLVLLPICYHLLIHVNSEAILVTSKPHPPPSSNFCRLSSGLCLLRLNVLVLSNRVF